MYNGASYKAGQCAVYRNKKEEGGEQDVVAKFILEDTPDQTLVDALFSEEDTFTVYVAGLQYTLRTHTITVVASDETPDYVPQDDYDPDMIQVALISDNSDVTVKVDDR